jgi:hypothetical protein
MRQRIERCCSGAPGGQRCLGVITRVELVATPELLLVDPMAAFNLAVLLWTSRFDVATRDAGGFASTRTPMSRKMR